MQEEKRFVRWIESDPKLQPDIYLQKLPHIHQLLGVGPFEVIEEKPAPMVGQDGQQFELWIKPPEEVAHLIRYNLWMWKGWFVETAAPS